MQDGFIGLHDKLDGLGRRLGRLQISVDGQLSNPDVGRKELIAWIGAVFTDDEYERALSASLKGTCDWILHRDVFRVWADSGNLIDETKVLWIHGPAGFGKTVLCAKLVAYLTQKTVAPVAHFFCVGADEAKRQPQAIVRSWVAQILNRSQLAVGLTAKYYHGKEARKATEADIWHLFKSLSSNAGPCFFVIDGYDECIRPDLSSGNSFDSQANFLKLLTTVTAETGSRLLLVSRYNSGIRSQLQSASGKLSKNAFYEYEITPEDTKEDISSFSHSMVEQELPNKPSLLKEELALEAARRCDGMFLWIKLMHIRLSPGKNAKQLREVVRITPTGLDQAYERDLRTILALETNERTRAISILRWTLFALRPLTVKELTEALLIRDSDTCEQFPADDLPDTWDEYYTDDQIRKLCGSLIELRSTRVHQEITTQTVNFVHFSVKEYLTSILDVSTPNVSTLRFPDIEYEHSVLAQNCLRYLCYEDFRVQDRSTQESLKNKTDQYALLQYATQGWYPHVFASGHHSRDVDELINKFFDPGDSRWLLWSDTPETQEISSEPFHEICQNGYPGPLYYASWLNLTRTVQHLISKGVDLNAKGGKYGSALQVAARNHDVDTVEILLQNNADVNVGGGKHGSAIVAAAASGSLTCSGQNIIRLLLERGADIESRDDDGWTALFWAAYLGDLNTTRLLCKYKADHHVVGKFGETPLLVAAAGACHEVVNILLDLGSDLMQVNILKETVLHYAAYNNDSSVMKLLLDRREGSNHQIETKEPAILGAVIGDQQVLDINALDYTRVTPLHHAVSQGNVPVVKLLLECKADLHIADLQNCTCLHTAIHDRQETIVKYIVDAGANLDVVDEEGWTPLQIASSLGQEDISKYLLYAGADVNRSTELYSTPLHLAVTHGWTGLIEPLLLHGANPLSTDKFGRTAMDWASSTEYIYDIMLPYCINHQLTNQAVSDEVLYHSISAIIEKLKKMDLEDWGESSRMNYLGHCLLLIGDVKEAYTAFQQTMSYVSVGDTLTHGARCDVCSDTTAAIKGNRFVCCKCPDTDLCEPCMDKHRDDFCLPTCEGHDFIKIPGDEWQRLPDGKVNTLSESPDEWLNRIQEKYIVSKLTETRLASESGSEINESKSSAIISNS